MASIQTSITMADNISATLHNIINAVNLTVSAFQDVQSAASHDINANAFEGIREQINAATMATQQFESELSRIQPQSVPVEIEWHTPPQIDIFSGNGVERYKQEIQSANDMMNRMTFTQQQISNNAAAMRVLPPQALTDIQGMGSRIQSLRAQIEQVQRTRIAVVGVEQANAEVEQLRGQLSHAVQIQEEMNAAIDNMDVSGANAAYNQLNSIIDSTERHIRDNINEQQHFNNELRNGEQAANSLKGILGAMAGVFTVRAGVKWIQDSIDLTNQQIQAEQQLSNVLANQGASYEDFISLKQQAAAIQATSMYGDESMIGGAAELSTYLKDAEAVKAMMGTLANYAAGMSGGAEVSYQQMVDYATQLGKALDGTYDGLKKKGFELSDAQKEIIENGTDMEKALVIDEVISQSWAGLAEQMAQTPQGMITSMSNAFGDIRENIGAQLYPVILSVFTMIQSYLPQIEQMLYGFVPIIQTIIEVIGGIIEAAFAVYQFFVDNWSWIEPVIWGIVAAFVAWKVITLIQTAVTWLLTAANWALVMAILANPITWIVIAIAAVIAAIVAWANAVGGFRVLWLIVVNAILTAWDWVKIGFFTGVYWVIDLWDKMKLGMMTAGTAIANFMGDMKANVLMILQNMVNGAIDIINGFIGILNKIPGVNIGLIEQVTFGTQAQLENEAAKQAREDALNDYRNEINAGIAERSAKLDSMKDDARAATAERLAGIEEARAAAQQKEENQSAATTPSDFVQTNFDGAGQMGNIANDTANIAGNTAAMKNTGEEDLKYLRDIAERETINRYINIEMGGITTNNTVNSEVDLDGIAEKIYDSFGDMMMERIDISAEGVVA